MVASIPLEQRGACRRVDDIPAHVRDHRSVQPNDGAGPLPAAGRFQAELHASREQDLHADAHTEHRPSRRDTIGDDLVPADLSETGHARLERADAGYHESIGVKCRVVVGGHFDVGADPLQRSLGRPQVARSRSRGRRHRGGAANALCLSQRAFGGRHAGDTRVVLDGLPQRAGYGLVLRLGDVVRVAAIQRAHVQCDAGVEGQRFEHVPVDHGVVGRAGAGDRELHHELRLAGVHEVRPARHVDGSVGERLVHRDPRVAEPADAFLVS